jgi:hypothetical protein
MTVTIPSAAPRWPGLLLLSGRQGGGYAPDGDLGCGPAGNRNPWPRIALAFAEEV